MYCNSPYNLHSSGIPLACNAHKWCSSCHLMAFRLLLHETISATLVRDNTLFSTFHYFKHRGMAVTALLSESKWTLAATGLVLLVIRKLIVYNKLRHIAGPPTTGFFEFWHSLAFLSGKCHEWYAHANEKYGKVHLISLCRLILTCCRSDRSGRPKDADHIVP